MDQLVISTNFKMTGKSKQPEHLHQFETFQNIKHQFETDIDATSTALISKLANYFLLFIFLKKCSLTPYLKPLRVFDNFKHVGKLFQTVGIKQNNVFWREHVLLYGCFSFHTPYIFRFHTPSFYYCFFRNFRS